MPTRAILLASAAAALAFVPAQAAESAPYAVVGGGKVSEIFWVRLDKGALVLESLEKILAEHGVTEGAAIAAVGGLDKCRFHGVGGTMTEVEEPVELLQISGLIVEGEPHFHVVVSNKERGAFGGHLEHGCSVLSQVEIGIAKFGGTAMTRKGADGKRALQRKR